MRRSIAWLVLALVACEPSCMGLPTSREETATGASPVSSVTVNAIQDAIVGGKVAAHWRWYAFDNRAPVLTNIALDNGGGVYDGRIRANGGAGTLKGYALPAVPVGYRPTALKMWALGTGAAGILRIVLYRNRISVGYGALGILTAPSPVAAAVAEFTLDPLTTVESLAAGDTLLLEADLAVAGMTVFMFGVKYDKL